MEEKIFLDLGDVKVTSARFIAGNQTFAMAGVTSVKSDTQPAKIGWALIVAAIGGLMLFSGEGPGRSLGFFLIGAGGLRAYFAKATYWVVLGSASGETKALSSPNISQIDRIIAALNDALVHRG